MVHYVIVIELYQSSFHTPSSVTNIFSMRRINVRTYLRFTRQEVSHFCTKNLTYLPIAATNFFKSHKK